MIEQFAASRSKTVTVKVTSSKPYNISNIPGEIGRRIFIGGHYGNIAVLREISRMVLERGYQPILAADFDISREKTREDTLRLLHACRTAIFEVSFRGDGHIIEIDKTKEFDIKTFLVYQIISTKHTVNIDITSMININKYDSFGYETFRDLENYISSIIGFLI